MKTRLAVLAFAVCALATLVLIGLKFVIPKNEEQVAREGLACLMASDSRCLVHLTSKPELEVSGITEEMLGSALRANIAEFMSGAVPSGPVVIERASNGVSATQTFVKNSNAFVLSFTAAKFDDGARLVEMDTSALLLPAISLRDKNLPPLTGEDRVQRLYQAMLWADNRFSNLGLRGCTTWEDSGPKFATWSDQRARFAAQLAKLGASPKSSFESISAALR